MKLFTGVILLMFFLTSCTPSDSSIQTAIVWTQVAFPTTTFTATSQPVTPSFTPKPSPTLTGTITPTPTPLPIEITEITDNKGVSMRLVSAGEFTMGSDDGPSDEQPAHQVYLDDFYMDIYEVTNALYEACVDAGGCTQPQATSSYTRSSYYGNSQYADYPVIYVDWNQAITYCEWRDASLPSEAQWEKAAKGTDGRTYPWGEDISCNKANYYDGNKSCGGDTTKVGSYLNGVSPYGTYDMAGNVWEWVSSLYQPYPYSPSDGREDLSSSGLRALRGGSWFSYDNVVRSAYRSNVGAPDIILNFVGFRCARSLP